MTKEESDEYVKLVMMIRDQLKLELESAEIEIPWNIDFVAGRMLVFIKNDVMPILSASTSRE